MTKFITQKILSRKAKGYIKKIKHSWQSAFESIILSGQILQKAKADLDQNEWHNMITHELPFTRRTAEKLIAISSDPRITDPKNADILPPRWTSLEAITRLSDKQFKDAVKKGVIHAEAERKQIEAIVTPKKAKAKTKNSKPKSGTISSDIQQEPQSSAQLALMQNDQRRPIQGQATDIVVAELSTDRKLSKKEARELEKALASLSQEHGITLKLSGNLKKFVLIQDLERQIHNKSEDFRHDARDNDLNAITDAFYQFETGKNFPKNPNGSFKKTDIRNPQNEFHDFDKEQLYGYCQDLQLLTQYTPIDFLDHQGFVAMLEWRFLTGNELQKAEAYRTLEKLVEKEKEDNRIGRRKWAADWEERNICSSAIELLDEQ